MQHSALRIALFAFLMTINVVFARQARVLTLESAVDISLEKNVSVIQAKNNLEATQSSTTAAFGSLLPTVDATGNFSRRMDWSGTYYLSGIAIPNPNGTSFSASNSWSADVSASLLLFNGFANTSNIRRAQANATASEYTLSRTMQNTVYQTHQLFLNVVRTFQLLKVSEDNLKRSQQQLERITESNKVGAVALADVYRQQVQAGTDELALIQAQSNHEKAKADMIAYLGIDFNTEYTFDLSGVPDSIDTSEFDAVNAQYADFNGLVSSATEKRPDYRASIENSTSADASVTVARGGHFPSVSAFTSYGYTSGELSHLTDNRGLSLGLRVSVPLFSGFSTQNQIEQAQIQKQNANEQLLQSQRQIRVDVRKALLDLEAAEKQVKVTQKSVQSAEMDRKIAEEKYNLGAGTLLDLLIANANYTTALSNKVNAVIGYLLSKKGVEFALGTINK